MVSLEGKKKLSCAKQTAGIRPIQHPRDEWDKQFKLMAECGDDRLLDAEAASLTGWDADGWEFLPLSTLGVSFK